MLKKFIENVFDKLGYIVIPKWKFNISLHGKRMQRIISEYQIDCILDVGANIGQYRSFLRNEVGYSGLIISFEPDPDNFKSLKKASQSDDQWLIQDYALGKENTELSLNIMKNSLFNSFLDPDNTETNQFEKQNSIKATVEVPVKRLDGVFPLLIENYKFKRAFLKIDTQGFDLDVFEGTFGCIDRIFGIQSEVSVMQIYKNSPSFGDSLKLFRKMGFEVSAVYAVDETRFPHALEFDCIYLKTVSRQGVV